MKKTIDYSRDCYKRKRTDLFFQPDTGNTEIAAYVAGGRNDILASIDGPEGIMMLTEWWEEEKKFWESNTGIKISGRSLWREGKGKYCDQYGGLSAVQCKETGYNQGVFEGLSWLPKEMVKKCDYVEYEAAREEDISMEYAGDGEFIGENWMVSLDAIEGG